MYSASLIGYGYWGKILRPYIDACQQFELKHIYTSKDKVDWNTDAIFIAAPNNTHYKLIKQALMNGVHVFCEKPIAKTYRRACELRDIASSRKLALVTDFTWMFSDGIKYAVKIASTMSPVSMLVIWEQPFMVKDIVWRFGPHLLSILSMMTPVPLALLNYEYHRTISGFTVTTHYGKFSATLYASSNYYYNNRTRNRTRAIIITCADGLVTFNPRVKPNTVVTGDSGISYNDTNEKDNLAGTVQHFADVINGKAESNIELSVDITREIENWITR